MQKLTRRYLVGTVCVLLSAELLGTLAGFYFGFSGEAGGSKTLRQMQISSPQLSLIPILAANLHVALLMCLGFWSFGAISLVECFITGSSVGVALRISTTSGCLGCGLIRLAPHGVIELVAFAIIGSCEFAMIPILFGQRSNWKSALKKITLFAAVGAIMLIIAGFIEAFVTPILSTQIEPFFQKQTTP